MALNRDFGEVIWDGFYEIQDVNKALAVFDAIIKRLFDKHAPVTGKRVRGKPCQ